MRMNEFDRTAWHNFAGCESWSGERQTLPLIGEGRFENGQRYCLVLDRTGGCLMVEDDLVNDFGGRCLEMAFPSQAAARAFAVGIGEPKTMTEFLVLGFREV